MESEELRLWIVALILAVFYAALIIQGPHKMGKRGVAK